MSLDPETFGKVVRARLILGELGELLESIVHRMDHRTLCLRNVRRLVRGVKVDYSCELAPNHEGDCLPWNEIEPAAKIEAKNSSNESAGEGAIAVQMLAILRRLDVLERANTPAQRLDDINEWLRPIRERLDTIVRDHNVLESRVARLEHRSMREAGSMPIGELTVCRQPDQEKK